VQRCAVIYLDQKVVKVYDVPEHDALEQVKEAHRSFDAGDRSTGAVMNEVGHLVFESNLHVISIED